ncbi:hypothetical protein V6N13_110980 [Hibiscus sabdariffa]
MQLVADLNCKLSLRTERVAIFATELEYSNQLIVIENGIMAKSINNELEEAKVWQELYFIEGQNLEFSLQGVPQCYVLLPLNPLQEPNT